MKKIEKVWIYLFALLPLIGFIIFHIGPILVSILAMFTNLDLYNIADFQWNDFEGFRLVFDKAYSATRTVKVTEYFVHSIKITLWIASAQLISLTIAFIMSVLLAKNLKGSKAFQTFYFVPYICSSVAVALMWQWVFADNGGILNSILGTNINWTREAATVTWCIIIAIVWQAPGYGIVMYRAALGNVNQSLYEAADLDGANALRKVWHITIPAVAPTTFYLLMSGITTGLLSYDLAALIAKAEWGSAIGGVDNMGLTVMRLIKYLMDPAVVAEDPAYMSAAAIISWLLFIVTATLATIVFIIRNRRLKND